MAVDKIEGGERSLRHRLVQGGLGLGSISLVASALSLLIGLLIARSLGPQSYGYYAFAGSVIALLAIPAQMGLPKLLSREVAALLARGDLEVLRGLERWSARFALLMPLAVGILFGGAVLLVADTIPALDRGTFAIALLLLPVLGMASRDQGCLAGLRRVIQASWPNTVLKPIVTLAGLGLVYAFVVDLTPQLAMWINVFSAFLAAFVTHVLLVRAWPGRKLPSVGRSKWKGWVQSLIPFGLLAAVSLINAKTDLLMLGVLTSAEEVGRYSIAVQGGLLVSFALVAFNSVLAPNVAHMHAVGEMRSMQRVLNRSTAILLVIALIVFGFLGIFGKTFIGVLFGEAFLPAYAPLVILAAGQLINVAFGSVGQFLTMTGHEKDALQSLLISAVVNVLLNALLIPRFGGVGAATATTVSVLFWNVLLSLRLYQRLGLTPGPFKWSRLAG